MQMEIHPNKDIPAVYPVIVSEINDPPGSMNVAKGALETFAENESWVGNIDRSKSGEIRFSVFASSTSDMALSYAEKAARIDGVVDAIQKAVEDALRSERDETARRRREREEWVAGQSGARDLST